MGASRSALHPALPGWVLASLAIVCFASPVRAVSSVKELVREARAHVDVHEDDLALRRYAEALSLDPTCEEAYLGLGELRTRQGDAREAERVYSVALEHVPTSRPALAGRARARRSLGQRDLAEHDLDAYATAEEDPAAMRELAGWFGEDDRTPSQLAAWRWLLNLGARRGDAQLVREARTMVRALQILVGPVDPVTAPSDDPVRRGLSAIARRGG